MKSSLMRSALVLAMALGLASCGGKAGFTIAGQVTGLQYAGLTLSTNGMTIAVAPSTATPPAPVKFAFPDDIEYGEVYNVIVATPPANQDCVLDYTATNTAGRLSVINVAVACSLKTSSITGTVTGLKGSGLKLINGTTGGTVNVVASTTTPGEAVNFTFANIPFGQTYGISVLAQPTDQTCTISPAGTAPSGIMDADGVEKIAVECK